MTLYIDLYFLTNLTCDLICLATAGRILHLSTKIIRLIFASSLGALYSCVAIVFDTYEPFKILLFLTVPAVMLFITYGKCSFSAFFKRLFLYFSSSLVLGGVLRLFFEHIAKRISFGTFFAVCFLSFFVMIFFFDIFSVGTKISHIELEAICKDKKQSLRLLCDSGNLLHDPFDSLPVILIKREIFNKLFPQDILYEKAVAANYKLRIIPISTATGKALIPAARAESLSYIKDGKRVLCNALLAGCENAEFADYDGIFPVSLL